jgi:flagellar hook-associated protein 2
VTLEALNLTGLNVDSSGRVSFSGLSSGIDFQGAVDNIIAAKRLPADRLELQISENEARVVGLQDLKNLLNGLKETLADLRGAVSFGGAGNVFKNKQAFATTSRTDGAAPSAAGGLVGVTVTNAAESGSHEIELLRVAKSHKIGTDRANSLTSDLGLAFGGASGSISGGFDVNGVTVAVQANDTLLDLRDRINNANSGALATGVTASVVSVGPTEHVLVLTADETGSAVTLDNESGGVLASLGISADGGSTFSNELQIAQTARLTADGLTDPDRFFSRALGSTSTALSTNLTAATYPGSFTINGTGAAVVNYTATTTLTQLRDAINAENGMTGVTATIETDSAGARLILTHDSSQAFTLSDTSGLLSELDLRNDLVIERSSNTIDDLYTGVTLSLFQAEEGTTAKIDVEPDLSAVKSQVVAFVDSYNALKAVLNQQQLADGSTGQAAAEAGVLFGEPVVADIERRLSSLLGAGVEGADAQFSVLAQIGVDFVDNGSLQDPLLEDTLQIDDTTLDSALLNNPDEVRRLFGFDFSTSDPRVVLLGFTGGTQHSAAGYTVNIGNVGIGQQDSTGVNLSTVTLDDGVDGFGATTSGSFDINGTPVAYDVTTDTLDDLADTINAAAIAGISAVVATASDGTVSLQIKSTSTALAINNDTGDLLSALGLSTTAYLVGQANIGGAANGADDGTVTTSGQTMTVTDQSGANGLRLFFNGAADLSGVQLDFTVGVAAQMFFAVDGLLDTDTGAVENGIQSLEDQNEIASDRIEAILERLEIQRQSLLDRFLRMEEALASMNNALDSIRQITDAMFQDR